MKMGGLASSDCAGGRNKAKTVTDSKLLSLATAGADWFCSHCGSGNRGDGDSCVSCGAPRYGKAEEDHPDFDGDHRRIKGWDERLREQIDAQDGPLDHDDLFDAVKAVPPPPRRPRRVGPIYEDDEVETYLAAARERRHRTFMAAIGGVTMLAVLVIAFVAWALSTHEVEGTVTKMTWAQTTYVQTWTQVTERRWKDETRQRKEIEPRNGSGERAGMVLLGGCREEHHHDEQYVCGSHQECTDVYTTEDYACGETCSDNGNGFATCTTQYCSRQVFSHQDCRNVDDYCDRPIYETKCDYQTQEWQTTKTVPASGTGRDTRWPDPPTGRLDRQRFAADYTVTIAYEDDGPQEYNMKPGNTKGLLGFGKTLTAKQARKAESSYLEWSKGESVTLKVNNLGGVHSVTHGGLEVVASAEE